MLRQRGDGREGQDLESGNTGVTRHLEEYTAKLVPYQEKSNSHVHTCVNCMYRHRDVLCLAPRPFLKEDFLRGERDEKIP
mmetsp:Transcript_6664/g.15236  ORF Transcript_6664/g.15236 Transcript_6664/m.15236 type:complete len:80 (-) Transcript_6664:107-346(-)